MKTLFPFLGEYKLHVLLGPFFKLIEAIFELIVPLVMASIIDIGIPGKDIQYVIRMGILLLVLGVVGLGCSFVCQSFAARASQGSGTKLRSALFQHINSFSYAELDAFGTSSLVTRMTNDINQLQVAVAMLIRLVVRAPFLAIGAMIMAMQIDKELSVIFLIATPLIVGVLYFIMSKSVPFYTLIQQKLEYLGTIAAQSLSGVRVIRAFSRQKKEQERFCDAADEQCQTAMQIGKITALLNPTTFIVVNLAIVAIVWFGGIQVNHGALQTGQIIALVNYMTQTLLALIVVANLVVTFTKAFASAKRVSEVLNTQPSIVSPAGDIAPKQGAPKLEFVDVSFTYQGAARPALQNISFTLEAGQTLGIIGATGCGKTTLINLIARQYDATSGEVLLDGQNVKLYDLQTLRDTIAVVPQKAALFSGSIQKNMMVGNKNASKKQMEQALKLSQAWEFVQSSEIGVQREIVQGAKNISGGQKQRISIARAMVKDAPILILDDSSSALDLATDALLRKALHTELAQTTKVIVSQRISSMMQADKILVLDNAKAVGQGDHQTLMKKCPAYVQIYASQSAAKEVGA